MAKDRLQTGPLIAGHGKNRNGPVKLGRQVHPRLTGAGAALVHRHAPADVGALGTPPVGRAQRRLQSFFRFHAAPRPAQRVFFALADEINQAKLRRVHLELASDQIHVRFGGEDGLYRPRRAPETAGHGVGVNLQRLHVSVVDLVRGRRAGAADARTPRLHTRVGAGAVDRLQITRGHPAVALHAGLHFHHGVMIGIHRRQFFGVAQDDLHRPFGLLGEKITDRQLARAAFAAEVGADVDGVDTNLIGRDTRRLGELRAGAERPFGRRPGVHRSVVVDLDQKRLWFEIALMVDRNAKGMLQN